MNIQRATPYNEFLAKLIFLILPTTLVGYFLLYNANHYYSQLGDQVLKQTLYFTIGMAGGALFYAFRFRFLPTFLLLIFGLYTVYKGLDKMAVGEFDAFFISVQFWVFAILFTGGWLVGWGFIRVRYWAIIISAVLLVSCILMIAKGNIDNVRMLLMAFAPAVLYAVYIIFTAEQIYNYKDKSQKFWWFLTRRVILFGVLAVLLLGGVVYLMRGEIKETVDNFGGGGKDGKNNMLKKDKNGDFDLKDYSRLSSSLGRSNDLLFCAHIDNYFEGTDVPNPLYLTAFYYTKFDTLTETFERDSLIPSNDLFEPNPASLSLFATKTDSSVIRNAQGPKLRRTVDMEVYSKKLSPNTYLAPSTGFFVQPITVEKDFRDEFKSAFRAKSYVSELNSAYFVYNAPDPQIKLFQEKRFEVLRKVLNYEGTDPQVMKYYTFMPGDAKFRSISDLAHKVTANARTPVDKVIAIRDYFLSKNDNGEPLYKYTDNPGVPDIPSASKLMYFLFENHKGYCAYYAGATLFMLRSLGIPSRIAVGFLTVDRSDKNKGWYWYYADQAHAWVQVYFPGYGWLDFDTTVGNSDAQESPQPDQTPPMQPPKAYLAASGIITDVDTAKKILKLNLRHIVFHDKVYDLKTPAPVTMDVHIAAIRRDSIDVPLSTVQKGEDATAVSYAEAFKKLEETPGESAETLLKRFPDPEPIDEVYLKRQDVKQPEPKPEPQQKSVTVSAKQVLLTTGIIAAVLLLLFFLLPVLVYNYYMLRYRNAGTDNAKAYWAYRGIHFYLHQAGIFRNRLTPMQYARNVIDLQMGTNLSGFMNIYLKGKYAKQQLTAQEQATLNGFVKPFIKAVRVRIKAGQRFKGFINPFRTIAFFMQPGEDE
ncbi:transglutaminase domain-containing protein [Chitinophagaceae bacterium MMS25-I14]